MSTKDITEAIAIICNHIKPYTPVKGQVVPIEEIQDKVIPDEIANTDVFIAAMNSIKANGWIEYINKLYVFTEDGSKKLQ